MEKTIGGDRLGSGKKMKVNLRTYDRSTHDLSYIWRSTMASGTLVPFLKEVALPGDTFDITLDADVKTHPTIGPLFGSYKVQLDVFLCPIRLYQAQLHNNKLGVGMDMSQVKLPQITIEAPNTNDSTDMDNSQINPSCIFSYLGIRGLGRASTGDETIQRKFNAIPYIAYWDIYKNYYANKQEEIGAVIHAEAYEQNVDTLVINDGGGGGLIPQGIGPAIPLQFDNGTTIIITTTNAIEPDPETIIIYLQSGNVTAKETWTTWTWDAGTQTLTGSNYIGITGTLDVYGWQYNGQDNPLLQEPHVYTFPLKNIDEMREGILSAAQNTNAFEITKTAIEPYNLPLLNTGELQHKLVSQEGLALKTYQSDLFNNWMSTEWIDGTNGINEITAIDTSGGSFTIDTLQLSKKVYDMLNRIAISGGSYDDWLDAVYTHERFRMSETPIYTGGLSKELVFQEVVSNSEAETEGGAQPLGTLAGKGVMGSKHKGGEITIKVDEPAYIIGLISLTPRIDYSQGNTWDTNLQTMDDFHKPALDEIGFQDLITDQIAWWDTEITNTNEKIYKSAGKQPAWINYMTNVNKVLGNFAIKGNEMFMTLNRMYEYDKTVGIIDLTTYIDPVKFNHIFAQTSRDAQNFWTQISVDMIARRKMSAKIMPNL